LKTAVIATTHNDYSGGGRYCLQLASALSRFFDVSMAGFSSDLPGYTGSDYRVKPYSGDFKPDLFIAVSHHGLLPPIGRVNAHVCFFPLESARLTARQYDLAISICDFADRYQRDLWGLPSVVINPYVRLEEYDLTAKEPIILNVGNYFLEANGHSKNQHLLIDWYLRSGMADRCSLVCTGFVGSRAYYDSLRMRAAAHPKIHLLTAISAQDLRNLYARASWLVHLMGYGRRAPHETEHFGYVAIEAMASGCQPVVHDSGGCRDIDGVRVWRRLADVPGLLTAPDPDALRVKAARYSFGRVLETQVLPFAKQVIGAACPAAYTEVTCVDDLGAARQG
jgi:glycosyltransferase involved in cell wall biosynthesis